MKWLRPLFFFLCMALAVACLAGCANLLGLSAEQQQAALQRALEMHSKGQISDLELEAFKAVLDRGNFDWENLLWSAGSIIGSLFGVRIWRGGTMNRHGMPPKSMVVAVPEEVAP